MLPDRSRPPAWDLSFLLLLVAGGLKALLPDGDSGPKGSRPPAGGLSFLLVAGGLIAARLGKEEKSDYEHFFAISINVHHLVITSLIL